MNCPLCGYDNLPGSAECDVCGASLTQDDVPQAIANFERHLQDDAVSVLEPATPLTAGLNMPLGEAVAKLRDASIGCLIVTNEDGEVVGLLSERDLLEKAALEIADFRAGTVEGLMTRSPETVQERDPVAYALQRMMVGDHRHLPVIDSAGRAVGVVSSRDVVQYIERVVAAARKEGAAA
ncbi:MAG: CBS domain-containing protein [Nitrospirae bacterium]|nr:CBS domain-containing protein [Nitrospirota bacterium]